MTESNPNSPTIHKKDREIIEHIDKVLEEHSPIPRHVVSTIGNVATGKLSIPDTFKEPDD